MANTFKQFNPPEEFDGRLTEMVIDDYDDPAENIDLGPTDLKLVHTDPASGSDVISFWDNVQPTLGSDNQDFMFPTEVGMDVYILKGGRFSAGLSCTVSNVGGTVLSEDPTTANTIRLVTDKV